MLFFARFFSHRGRRYLALADAIGGWGVGPVTFYPGALSFAAAEFVVFVVFFLSLVSSTQHTMVAWSVSGHLRLARRLLNILSRQRHALVLGHQAVALSARLVRVLRWERPMC
jgi:hypothetical protein